MPRRSAWALGRMFNPVFFSREPEPPQRVRMRRARIAVIVGGLLVTHVARAAAVPFRGVDFASWYFTLDASGWLIVLGLSSICWGTVLLSSIWIRDPRWLAIPAVAGIGYLAVDHFQYDPGSDAQAGLIFVTAPIVGAAFAVAGGVLAVVFEKATTRSGRHAA